MQPANDPALRPSERARDLVRGAYDLHVHPGPDMMPRAITDIELARRCQQWDQAGFVIKSHYVSTAERAAVVRLVSEAEAIEILETRAVLEGLAARHAARNASPEDIAALRALLVEQRRRIEAGDLLGSSEINARLHQKLLQIANHATVSRLLDVLKIQNVRFQYRTILVPGRPERSFKEHSAIVEAVAAHDAEAAEAAVRTHLSHVCEALRQTRHAHNNPLHMQPL